MAPKLTVAAVFVEIDPLLILHTKKPVTAAKAKSTIRMVIRQPRQPRLPRVCFPARVSVSSA